MRKHGFTLIELLIVIAIIAILALIAIPNFLEAQTRSRVSRAEADMRTLATGLEAYSIDWDMYPSYQNTMDYNDGTEDTGNDSINITYPPYTLTTPVGYVTTMCVDPFRTVVASVNPARTFIYWKVKTDRLSHFRDFDAGQLVAVTSERARAFHSVGRSYFQVDDEDGSVPYEWFLSSAGPDMTSVFADTAIWDSSTNETPDPMMYDPTNGVSSLGELMRWGP